MRILVKTFSRDRARIGIDCACGISLFHQIKNGQNVECPACGALEDISTLLSQLLKTKSYETVLKEVEQRSDLLSKEE
jgi:uncharacterized Zn finger protein (UPF0148 family)